LGNHTPEIPTYLIKEEKVIHKFMKVAIERTTILSFEETNNSSLILN